MRRVRAGLERFRAQGDAIARDVTLQMGKPIREARREVQTFFERAEHMLAIAAQALAPEVLPEKDGLHRRIEHAPLGRRPRHRGLELPAADPGERGGARAAGRQRRAAQAQRAHAALRRALRARVRRSGAAGARREPRHRPRRRPRRSWPTRARWTTLRSRAPWPAARPSTARRPRACSTSGLELGGKDPAYVAEDADLDLHRRERGGRRLLQRGPVLLRGRARVRAPQACTTSSWTAPAARCRPIGWATRSTRAPRWDRWPAGPALDTLEGQVGDAVRRGARLLLGGRRLPDTRGNFFPPTLLADVPERGGGDAGGELRAAAAGARRWPTTRRRCAR